MSGASTARSIAPPRRAPPRVTPRGGLLDLALVGVVLVAVWGHTPAGALLARAARWLGADVDVPSLVAGFEVESLWEVVDVVVPVGPIGEVDLDWPVDRTWPVSSRWGMRVHPVYGDLRFHNGVDLAVPVGTPVRAPRDGVVDAVTEDERSGRTVVIEHGDGLRTAYCHLSEIAVAVGQAVSRGQMFALSGNTGRSTGPHLHFVVRVNGKAVDPLLWAPEPTPAS